VKKPTAVGFLIALLLVLAGCATTVQHPTTPGDSYASLEACQEQHPEEPETCAPGLPPPSRAWQVASATALILGHIAWLLVILLVH
jgi:hypothetical protein